MPRTAGEQRVAVEQLEVAGQLLDAVDLAASLDLDGDRLARRRRDTSGRRGRSRSGTRGVRASGRRPASPGCSASSSWRCFSTPSFCRPGSTPRSWLESCRTSSIRMRRLSPVFASTSPLDLAVLGGALLDRAGRAHPVQRLVGAAVGVHQHRSVGLEHQHPGGHRQVSGQPSGVVDLTAGHDESHERRIYLHARDLARSVSAGPRPAMLARGSSGRGGSRGHRPVLRRPAGRGRPPGRRTRPRPAAGDDLGGGGGALVPLQGAARGPGHRLVGHVVRRLRGAGQAGHRGPDAVGHRGARTSAPRTRGGPARCPTWSTSPRSVGTPTRGASPRR